MAVPAGRGKALCLSGPLRNELLDSFSLLKIARQIERNPLLTSNA
jgi:hypothetical protein